MKRLIFVSVLAGVGLACEDDPPTPSGNLARPAGLAYIERDPARTGDGSGVFRSDLLIADSEAQGVRIAQFLARAAEDGALEFEPLFFVPAPVAFFKLAARAPGFPTDVEVVERLGDLPARAYVLAPASGQLHVLEVGGIPYRGAATSDTNVPIFVEDLLEGDPSQVAVALERVGSSPTEDFVLVAFDGFGAEPGRLRLYAFTRVADPGPPRVVAEVPVPAGVSDVIAPTSSTGATRPRVLVSSTATSAVTEVAVVGSPATGELALGDARALDGGGPISALVDAGGLGVFGLRLDRSAVTWLPYVEGRFERSRARLVSPFDDPDPGDSLAEPGVLTLRQPLAVVGAHARLRSLVEPGGETNVLGGSGAARDVVLIVHEDARALFVVGGEAPGAPPRVAVAEPASPGFVVETGFAPVGEGEASPRLEGCEPVPEMCMPEPAEGAPPLCTVEQVEAMSAASPIFGGLSLRVTPYGPLYTARDLALRASVQPARVGTSTSGLVLDAVDASRDSLTPFRLRAGDRVRALLRLSRPLDGSEGPSCLEPGASVDLQLEGRLLGVGTGVDPRGSVVRTGPRLRAEVALEASSEGLEGGLEACAEDIARATTLRELQIHVPSTVDEAVVAEVVSEQVLRVLERVPLDVELGPGGTPQAVLSLGTQPGASTPLQNRVTVPLEAATTDALRSRLGCDVQSAAADADGLLGFCTSGVECGVGRACRGSSGGCPGRCLAECVGECFEARRFRVCERLDLQLSSSGILVDLAAAAAGDGLTNARFGSTPADAVFHPQRGAFFVSLPGARALVEVPTQSGARLRRVR